MIQYPSRPARRSHLVSLQAGHQDPFVAKPNPSPFKFGQGPRVLLRILRGRNSLLRDLIAEELGLAQLGVLLLPAAALREHHVQGVGLVLRAQGTENIVAPVARCGAAVPQ